MPTVMSVSRPAAFKRGARQIPNRRGDQFEAPAADSSKARMPGTQRPARCGATLSHQYPVIRSKRHHVGDGAEAHQVEQLPRAKIVLDQESCEAATT